MNYPHKSTQMSPEPLMLWTADDTLFRNECQLEKLPRIFDCWALRSLTNKQQLEIHIVNTAVSWNSLGLGYMDRDRLVVSVCSTNPLAKHCKLLQQMTGKQHQTWSPKKLKCNDCENKSCSNAQGSRPDVSHGLASFAIPSPLWISHERRDDGGWQGTYAPCWKVAWWATFAAPCSVRLALQRCHESIFFGTALSDWQRWGCCVQGTPTLGVQYFHLGPRNKVWMQHKNKQLFVG